MKYRPLVGAVGKQFCEEWEHPEQGRQQRDAAIAILDIGRRDERLQKQPLHVDENVALLSLDQLARVKAGRIDVRPPFSALLTLWLSTTHAVGLASRSSFSRHLT